MLLDAMGIQLLGFVLLGLLLASSLSLSASRPIQHFSLDGPWQFKTDPEGTLTLSDLPEITDWRALEVPGCWQAAAPDLREYTGIAWYRRTFEAPTVAQDQAAVLHFGAVNYLAEVFLNGQKAGEHEGGFLPFDLPVTDLLKPGLNEIVLKVTLPNDDEVLWGDLAFSQWPHGKQSWYSYVGGPWQSISLEIVPDWRFVQVHLTPDLPQKQVKIELQLNAPAPAEYAGQSVEYQIFSPEGRLVAQGELALEGSQGSGVVQLSQVRPWSPDDPALYTCKLRLLNGAEWEDTFGMRSFVIKDGKFYLNGQPCYLLAALDQAFYPDTIYTPPSREYLHEQFVKAKQMGLNMLRCHIKVPDPRYLEEADKVGLLVWYEIPNVDKLTDAAKRRIKATFDGMVARDFNHPSLVIYSLFNESWGIDLHDASQRKWLKELYAYAKQLDPTRPVVDNSACSGNFHVQTDIADFHVYHSIPDHARTFDDWVKEYAGRPKWLFSAFGDAEITGKEPLVVSEFGNWGLPFLEGLEQQEKGEPWWFGTDSGPTRPEGVLKRFEDFRYDHVYYDYPDLAEAAQWHEFNQLKYEIESIRLQPEIQGYVITEFTDLNWESNGLLDMSRHPKAFFGALHLVQQPDLVIARPARWEGKSGEKVAVKFALSHYSQAELKGARLEYALESAQAGELTLPDAATEPGTLTVLPEIELRLPEVSSPRSLKLTCRLVAENQRVLGENYIYLYVYPAQKTTCPVKLALGDSAQEFADKLADEGFSLAKDPASAEVLLGSRLDKTALDHLQHGGRVLLVPEEPQVLDLATGIEVVSRDREGRWGDWAGGANWRDVLAPVWSGAPFGSVMEAEITGCIPHLVVEGIPPEAFVDVQAGVWVGWLHANAAYLAAFNTPGGGLLVVSCLNDLAHLGASPYNTWLLERLLTWLASPAASAHKARLESLVSITLVGKGAEWRYTLQTPPEGWQAPGFDDSNWQEGKASFGTPGTTGAEIGTEWHSSDLWLRKRFEVDSPPSKLVMRLHYDEDVAIYLNGHLVFEESGHLTSYKRIELTQAQAAFLQKGDNVLAVYCNQTGDGQFVDVQLYGLD